MLRYVISPIIGTGVEFNDFRVAVGDVAATNHAAVIPTHTSGPNIGQPKYLHAMAIVATANLPAVAAVSNAFVFPDYPLDGRMDGMEAAVRAAMVQSVEAYDFDGQGYHIAVMDDDDWSYRQVLNDIGQQLEPALDIANLTVSEVAL